MALTAWPLFVCYSQYTYKNVSLLASRKKGLFESCELIVDWTDVLHERIYSAGKLSTGHDYYRCKFFVDDTDLAINFLQELCQQVADTEAIRAKLMEEVDVLEAKTGPVTPPPPQVAQVAPPLLTPPPQAKAPPMEGKQQQWYMINHRKT